MFRAPATGSAARMGDERDRTDQPLPGSVSDQNGEEAEPGHGGGERARRQGRPAAVTRSQAGRPGEGSQSTGHPDSAG